jgi:diaminohydroxyphosphoribosylaminopyrimidine deaminase/5-amino-6-(5-phosphoribosylamino)uracil reductase
MTDSNRDATDEFLMGRALALALEGWGQVAPNPMVGAVLASGGSVVGEGYHARFGADHAEIVALREGRADASGATLYVTLEPCAHDGKTPPCTNAIVKAGVRRVVFGCADPDPRAAGGARVLREAGLEVSGGVRAGEAARLNEAFIWERLGHGPWVSLKLALSLDGRIAEAPGVRTAISGPEATTYVHRLRAAHDAIVVGGRTACVDDPLLTVRTGRAPRVPPTRVVLDPDLRTPVVSRLVNTVSEAPVLILCRAGVPSDRRRDLERRGVEVEAVPGDGVGLALDAALLSLSERGLSSILVEGGGRLAAALLAGGFVRKHHLIYAPIFLGLEGVPSVGAAMTVESGEWSVVRREILGDDTLLELEDRRATDALREVA